MTSIVKSELLKPAKFIRLNLPSSGDPFQAQEPNTRVNTVRPTRRNSVKHVRPIMRLTGSQSLERIANTISRIANFLSRSRNRGTRPIPKFPLLDIGSGRKKIQRELISSLAKAIESVLEKILRRFAKRVAHTVKRTSRNNAFVSANGMPPTKTRRGNTTSTISTGSRKPAGDGRPSIETLGGSQPHAAELKFARAMEHLATTILSAFTISRLVAAPVALRN